MPSAENWGLGTWWMQYWYMGLEIVSAKGCITVKLSNFLNWPDYSFVTFSLNYVNLMSKIIYWQTFKKHQLSTFNHNRQNIDWGIWASWNFGDTYLNLHQVDWLHHFGLCSELACIQASASCWNNLTATTMNSICMQGHVMDVEANGTHVLFTEDTLKT